MTPFLFHTAQYMRNSYADSWGEMAVILPNRRAGLFLRKHLAGMISGTTWLPSIYSIEDFITFISGLEKINTVHCLLELYEVHREAEGEKAQPFDEFLNWGGQLISDFDEADRYLVDPKTLFTYLDEVRVLTVWNPGQESLTEFQKNYLRFYHSLLTYYTGLTSRILARGEAYQGLIYRHAWDQLQTDRAIIPWERLVFAGFNALTAAEERIIDFLVKRGQADILWDADKYYLDNPHQEAGVFLRRWFRKWPRFSSTWKFEDFHTSGKEIEVIGVPDLAGQAKYCGELLRKLSADGILDDRTAVVLPDERLLLPVLNSVPDTVEEMNITMGLPLRLTPMADLMEQMFRMHQRAEWMEAGRVQAGKFYYRDVLQILRHPYIHRLILGMMGGNHFAFQEVVEKISTGFRFFIGKEDIMAVHKGLFGMKEGILDLLFIPWATPADALTSLKSLVNSLVRFLISGIAPPDSEEGRPPYPVELEYGYELSRILHQLQQLVVREHAYLTLDTCSKLFRQLLETHSLPFSGEPLKGLQIMGVLETRALDFERVIILTCNEGILPAGKSLQTFIPHDVRKDLHLPLFHHRDPVYAYHFYRLLQRARQVWLVYTTEPDPLGGGEPSRFIRQIQSELPAANPRITVRAQTLLTPLVKGVSYPSFEIAKQPAVLERLADKATSGFAPTALNAYRACPLRFYLSEIAGLQEPEEAENEIDPKVLGSAVHNALRNLYLPYLNKPLTVDDVKEMEHRVDKSVDQAFGKYRQGKGVSTGKNLLYVRVARIMVRKFLRKEADLVADLASKGEGMTILMLEQHLSRSLRIMVNGYEITVRFKGFVDRVDRIGNTIRIIDYKTGTVASKEVEVQDWPALVHEPDVDKGFQLLLYAFLLVGKWKGSTMQAGILSLKKQGQGFLAVTIPEPMNGSGTSFLGEDFAVHMEELLREIVTDIFNVDKPFRQAGNPDRCTGCPFIYLCGR